MGVEGGELDLGGLLVKKSSPRGEEAGIVGKGYHAFEVKEIFPGGKNADVYHVKVSDVLRIVIDYFTFAF